MTISCIFGYSNNDFITQNCQFSPIVATLFAITAYFLSQMQPFPSQFRLYRNCNYNFIYPNCGFISHNCNYTSCNCDFIVIATSLSPIVTLYIIIATLSPLLQLTIFQFILCHNCDFLSCNC